jgi:hypothetical protein
MNYLDLVAPHETAEQVSDEYFFDRIRQWRSQELAASDWTQVADSTADKTAWAIYRQALRDLPASNADPKKIKFPSRPS